MKEMIQKLRHPSKLNRRERNRLRTYLRACIQLISFLLIPSAYTAAFAGIKYIFTQLGAGEMIKFTPFIALLLALCGYTIVFGRFFCGFACAFGTLGDAVRSLYVAIMKKRKKKPYSLPRTWTQKLRYLKYGILLAIVNACFGQVYGTMQGTSPWDVFSMLRAGNLKLDGYFAGIILLVLILIGMALEERFFCRFLCPMGAVFSLLPVLPLFRLKRTRENCIKTCSACTRICPADLELPDDGEDRIAGDCFQCQKCIGTCPKSNIHTGIGKIRGNEEYLTVLRAVLLIAMLLALGA